MDNISFRLCNNMFRSSPACHVRFTSSCPHIWPSTACRFARISRIRAASTSIGRTSTTTIWRSGTSLGFWLSVCRSFACTGHILLSIGFTSSCSHIRRPCLSQLSSVARIWGGLGCCLLCDWLWSNSVLSGLRLH